MCIFVYSVQDLLLLYVSVVSSDYACGFVIICNHSVDALFLYTENGGDAEQISGYYFF